MMVHLFQGDSLELLNQPTGFRDADGRLLRADVAITDPPYGFDFSGEKDWDTFKQGGAKEDDAVDVERFKQFTADWSYGLKRDILRPGSMILAFSDVTTVDLVVGGLRRHYDIIRALFWLYASGQVKQKNDLRPGCEIITVARIPADSLQELFRTKGIGQLNAQALVEEDGRHPTNVLIDQSLVDAYEEVARIIAEHPGTFFVPKPSQKDRDYGCDDLPLVKKDNRLSHMTSNYTGKVMKDVMARNAHPTVKPIELMRRLIRTCSRPGHTVIDPFIGSGSTGVAAVLEGRSFIGIERDPDYFKIAKARIRFAEKEMQG